MAKLPGVPEPVERISEVLFGIIIVLTFTCSLRLTRMDLGTVQYHAMGSIRL